MIRRVPLALLTVAAAAAPSATLRLGALPAVVTATSCVDAFAGFVVAGVVLSRFTLSGHLATAIQGCGYVTVPLLIVAFAALFPGSFVATPWPGPRHDAAPWVYAAWHAFAGILILVYCLGVKGATWNVPKPWRLRVAIACVAGSATLAGAIVWCCLQAAVLLPPLLRADGSLAPRAHLPAGLIGAALLAAFAVARTSLREGSSVERCVQVTALALFVDIAMCATGGGRYTLGWYTARVFAAVGPIVTLIAIVYDLYVLTARLEHKSASFERLALTDALTATGNKRALDVRLEREWEYARAGGVPLSLLMIDVDHFKRYNDRYGHLAGDACLRKIAAALRSSARGCDFIARFGGEEFSAVLPGTTESQAATVAQRFHDAVAALAIVHEDSPVASRVTLSIGCATVLDASAVDVARAVDACDRALYASKAAGRNTTTVVTVAAPTAAAAATPLQGALAV